MQKKTLTKTSGARQVPTASTAPVTTTPAIAAVPTSNAPNHEQIARRAYEIYEARGQTTGHELEDWIQAERELLAKAHRNN